MILKLSLIKNNTGFKDKELTLKKQLGAQFLLYLCNLYREIHKTVKQEDDFYAVFLCILLGYKAIFVLNLRNQLINVEMRLCSVYTVQCSKS